MRCDVGVWLEPDAFRAERRTGVLPAEDLERVRGRRHAFLEGRLEPSLLEAAADEDPEYSRWRETTLGDERQRSEEMGRQIRLAGLTGKEVVKLEERYLVMVRR